MRSDPSQNAADRRGDGGGSPRSWLVAAGERPWLASAVLALLMFAWLYPGQLLNDSRSQLAEAVAGRFTDWHPPMMALLWRAIGATVPAMLFVEIALHWFGIACLADALRRRGRAAWPMLLVGLMPLVTSYPGAILKDALLSASFIAAAGAIVRFGPLAGLLPACLGLFVRMNGMFGFAPLFARRLWLAALLAIALIPVSVFVNRTLIGASNSHAERSLQTYDVAGIRHHLGQDVPCYTPFQWDSLGRCGYPDPGTRTWVEAIAAHPLAYAAHRIAHFNVEIMWLVPAQMTCRFAWQAYSCDTRHRPILFELVNNPFIWPVTWLVVGLVLLAFRPDRTTRMLVLSGLCYGFAYLVVGVAYDTMRYYFWTELAVLAALVWHRPDERQQRTLLAVLACVWATGLAARIFA